MSDRKKVGVRIDADVWRAFREDVKERKGQTRGVLGDELERAIEQYLAGNQDVSTRDRLYRIESKLDHIQQEAGVLPADGGHTPDDGSHTHAPSRVSSAAEEKPAANAATEKKVAYLAECALDEISPKNREMRNIPRSELVTVVKDEYGFRSDTAKRYVDELVSYFDLQPHPEVDGMLVSEEWIADYVSEDQ